MPRLDRLRIGVVGLNARVERVVLPGIAASPRARLAAVCSRDSAKAAAFAGPYPECRPFAAYEEMLDSGEVDAVFVVTPPEVHGAMSLAAIERGLAVCCEKPLATSTDEAQAMVAAARRRGVRTAVNFTYRSAPGPRLVADLLSHPGIGDLEHGEMSYLQNRGLLSDAALRDPLPDLGAHAVDALLWWAEAAGSGVPVSVGALLSRGAGDAAVRWCLCLEMSHGSTWSLALSRRAPGRRNALLAALYGQTGALELDFDTDQTSVRLSPSIEPAWRPVDIPPELQVDYAGFPRLHFDRIVGALSGEGDFPDFEAGARVQAVLEAAEMSARDRSTIRLRSS